MSRTAFFETVRHIPFGGRLTSQQVTGITAILDEWQARQLSDARWLAYMLATTFHETARTMQPIRERGGEAYFHRMYDPHGDRPHVARALGNSEPGDGVRFHGRGYVQLTGRMNYARMTKLTGADLIAEPDLAMMPEIAVRILFEGMIGGLFTGHRLADYFSDGAADWRGARHIVNGLDRADEIAGHGRAFHRAAERLVPVASPTGRSSETAEAEDRAAKRFWAWLHQILHAIVTGGRA